MRAQPLVEASSGVPTGGGGLVPSVANPAESGSGRASAGFSSFGMGSNGGGLRTGDEGTTWAFVNRVSESVDPKKSGLDKVKDLGKEKEKKEGGGRGLEQPPPQKRRLAGQGEIISLTPYREGGFSSLYQRGG